jgi:S1-C subfamily serine protease
MKRIFSVCAFFLMLGVAAAQQSTNDAPAATNKIAGNTFEEIKAKAEKGDVESQCWLGLDYLNGQGVPQDFTEAMKWLLKAAEKGNAPAQHNIGFMYANGYGVKKDLVEAFKWYEKAADQHFSGAEFEIGAAYYNGDGVPQDFVEAVKWFEKSSDQGFMLAENNLANCYYNGEGVPKDYVEAYKWYDLALAQGLGAAQTNLSLVAQWMTAEQIAEAQQLAREFRPRVQWSSGNSSSPKNMLEPFASGTGFFITDDGYLISNYHVVKVATKVRLLTSAGLIDAKVVQVDAANDLALLKADGKFSSLPISSSRSAQSGGTVATVGFPDIGLQGFAPKLAKGEIASLSGAGDDPRYFQISVPVQPGNSGGALVDERGNVIGIVSAKLDASTALAMSGSLPENVNYAVKSSLLLSFLESVPDVGNKLKAPNTADEKFEEVVKQAQGAAVLVLVY